jgi:hypothetical protein
VRILALDLSKRSAGWACWSPDDQRVASGAWVLGSEYTSKGVTFGKLHQELSGLHRLGAIDALFYERPLNLGPAAGNTNINTIEVLVGLAMHAESWGDAMGCRIIRAVNQSSWRKAFLGSIPRARLKDRYGNRLPVEKIDLKALAMERCQQLCFSPRSHDQAEAIGILDYACTTLDIMPYWRANEVLRPPLGIDG